MALSIAQLMVQQFHAYLGFTVGWTPAIRDGELRVRLLEEECAETVEAIEAGDLVKAIDGLCDLIYVALGTAVTFGIPLADFFDEVHRTNMLKVGIVDGKGIKPDGWQQPRIKELLANFERLTHPPLSSVRSTDPSKE